MKAEDALYERPIGVDSYFCDEHNKEFKEFGKVSSWIAMGKFMDK